MKNSPDQQPPLPSPWKELAAVKSLIQETQRLAAEHRDLDAFHERHRAEWENAFAHGNIRHDDDAAIQKLALVNVKMELVPAARRQLAKDSKHASGQLKTALRAAHNAWARHIRDLREAKFAEFVATIAPYYNGDTRLVRREFNEERMPCLFEHFRANAFGDLSHVQTFEDALHSAQWFMRHVEKYSKVLGFKLQF